MNSMLYPLKAINDNFATLATPFKTIDAENKTVELEEGWTLSADNLAVNETALKQVATFTVSGDNIANTTATGTVYQLGKMYVYDFKGMSINVGLQMTAGTFYTINLTAQTGTLPTATPWIAMSAATNISPVIPELTLMTTSTVRVKPVGGGISTSGYIRPGNAVFFV
ncbi:hypothetical protein [Bacillus subtilis]|uniref:hypothetical protein n=1 Tax=Bacillus subtilis TaxID=1423 RepID=UPI0039830A84